MRSQRLLLAGLFGICILSVLSSVWMSMAMPGHLEREREIRASPDVVARLVSDPTRWPEWTIWTSLLDPDADLHGGDAGLLWSGPLLGEGGMSVVARTDVGLSFKLERRGLVTDANITWQPTTIGTRVVWTESADLGVGPSVEAMLDRLASVAEKTYASEAKAERVRRLQEEASQ